jgi:ADP-ribose pyrophosphatase YjhB (NUDIX family)
VSKWTELAIRVQSLAQGGLAYSDNPYDRERYEELREIAAQMLSCETEIPTETIKTFFCNETGYQTPKIDTRAAVFQEDKILLVHEKNGTWSLPGGWCDVDQSVASNVIKETKEEAGLDVVAEQLIAVQDWRKHNPCNLPYGVIKLFVQCRAIGGAFDENIETTEIRYFDRDALPEHLAAEKNTAEQIQMCFDAYQRKDWKTVLD